LLPGGSSLTVCVSDLRVYSRDKSTADPAARRERRVDGFIRYVLADNERSTTSCYAVIGHNLKWAHIKADADRSTSTQHCRGSIYIMQARRQDSITQLKPPSRAGPPAREFFVAANTRLRH
jgi:hypothetical protein